MLIDVKPINIILFVGDGIIIRLIAGFNRLFRHCLDLDEIQDSLFEPPSEYDEIQN